MYPIRSSARSAGISSFLACCSRPVSGRSLSMDLLLDHISLLPDFSTLLHDDMLLALAFHSCPLTLFPADSYCLVSGMFLYTCIPRRHLSSFLISLPRVISHAPSRLRGVCNRVHFTDAMQNPFKLFPTDCYLLISSIFCSWSRCVLNWLSAFSCKCSCDRYETLSNLLVVDQLPSVECRWFPLSW